MTDTLIAAWDFQGIAWKLFEVDREDIDPGSDENNAYDLVGVEMNTGLRRVSERLDFTYDRQHIRPGDNDLVDNAVQVAPDEVQLILERYGWNIQ